MQEDYYPRGGSRPKIANDGTFKSENLFTTLHKSRKKEKPAKKQQNEDLQIREDADLHLTSADLLTYEKILPGMLILGCVRDITSYAVHVELPGRTFAKIGINAISDTLSKNLLDKAINFDEDYIETNVLNILSKIFKCQQFLPTLILDVSENENASKRVAASINPKQINANLTYNMFKKGMLVWGCISEKSDHVYIVSLGVKNTRIILPFTNCYDQSYIEGEPLWLIVKEVKIQDKTTTLTVSAIKEEIQQCIKGGYHLDQILPGMCVELSVTKILKDGLEGIFLNDYLGYINEIYLNTPMESTKKYEGTTVKAFVLYVNPTTKITYLTMRSLETSDMTILPKGHICSAKIINKIGKGVVIKLNKTDLGLVTYKRLVKSLKVGPSSNLSELVKKKFPVGSTHKCRILDYVNMDKMYICTFERNIVQEEIFDKNDLKLGQVVKGVVEEINRSGICVKIGKIIAFVTNEHLSNVQYSENIKKSYHIGDNVTARVWNINGKNVKLTLKPLFVKDDRCLKDYKLVKKNEQYPGMIVKNYEGGAVICFYGGIKGWLKSKQPQQDYSNMFHHGQVVIVTVLACNNNKLVLTLDPPVKTENNKKIRLGQIVSGTVESIKTNGIFIRTTSGNFQGFVPVNHLSIDCNLSKIILGLYNLGDKIDNLICISKEKKRILSVRESFYYINNKFHIPKRNELEPGLVLRCSVKSFDKKKLLLQSPILFFSDDIIVNKEDIVKDSQTVKYLNLSEGQAIVAKLTLVNDKQVLATTDVSEIFDCDSKYPVNLLRRYLLDVDKIHQKLMQNGDALAQYKIGQQVTCQILKINNIGCSVKLSDEVQGIVAPEHWPNKPLVDSVHIGVVLYINFVDRYLEISLNNQINDRISRMQGNVHNIKIDQTLYAKVLLIRPEFVLCSLGQQGNRQIGYMPTALHENDFTPNYNYYRNLDGNFKFIVSSIVNGKIVGLEKNFKHILEKEKKLHAQLANKRKRSMCDDENGTVDVKKRKRMSSSSSSNDQFPVKRSVASRETNDVQSDSDDEKTESDKMEESVEFSNRENEDMDFEEGSESEEVDTELEVVKDVEAKEEDEVEVEENQSNLETKELDFSEDEENEIGTDQNDASATEGVADENDEKSQNKCDKNENGTSTDLLEAEVINDDTGSNSNVELRITKATHNRRVSFNDAVKQFLEPEGERSSDVSLTFVPPGVKNFFDSDEENSLSSDSDEDVVEEVVKPKKKKLTRAEQVEQLKQKEEELLRKEAEIADPVGIPQSAEQFDRRLLADPNSSELWTQYISFHLASTEIEKARAVIKRALQTINLRAEQDRLNIWIASLNLENYYGTKDDFSKMFEEAVRCNDDFTMYMQAIKMLASTADVTTLDEYIRKARAKFKQQPKMYIDIGKIYYGQKKFVEARRLKDIALKTITNTAEHIPLIVQFAIMEFNYGEDQHAEALFETILQSNPRRVDVWSTYVDQLVKRNKITIARRVLERAVTQKLNVRKMKTLHKKFYDFEKVYGDDETRAQQRKMLEEYTKQFGNLATDPENLD